MLVDCHCHLTELSPEELQGVLQRAADQGVEKLVAIGAGYGFDDNLKTLNLAREHSHIFCALGMHPHDAKAVTPENFELLRQWSADPKVRAIGEIGLDYHYMHSPQEVQHTVLRQFISLAHELHKPVVIHDRDCQNDCVAILKQEDAGTVGGMVHCFTGSKELARAYLDLGFYVSFTGVITFKKADDLRDVVRFVPLDRMLIETDSPFLAPLPFRGKRNEPAFVRYVAECVAQVKNIPFATVAEVTTQNASQFFQF